MMPRAQPPALVRGVGWFSLTAIAINGMVGAGIFALPANVAQLLGAAAPLAYITAGVAILLIALCFAEAGSLFEGSGGPFDPRRASRAKGHASDARSIAYQLRAAGHFRNRAGDITQDAPPEETAHPAPTGEADP